MFEETDCLKNDSIVYIAGKYLGKTPEETELNIIRAREAMLRLSREGWFVYCPHSHSSGFEIYEDIPNEFWYQHGELILSKCNAIYMLEGWEESKGAIRELELALDLGLPVFYEVE